MAAAAGVEFGLGEAAGGGWHGQRLASRESMVPPVLSDIDEVGRFEVVAEASEALPTLMTQDTGVVAVDDTKDAVTRWVSRQCLGGGRQSATAVETTLMCAA